MTQIRVALIDHTGSKKTLIELPDDVPVEQLIPALVISLNLPTQQSGNPVTYRLDHPTTGQRLADDKTLADVNIGADAVLFLLPEVTATLPITASDTPVMQIHKDDIDNMHRASRKEQEQNFQRHLLILALLGEGEHLPIHLVDDLFDQIQLAHSATKTSPPITVPPQQNTHSVTLTQQASVQPLPLSLNYQKADILVPQNNAESRDAEIEMSMIESDKNVHEYLTLLVPQDDGFAEIKIPTIQLKAELERILQQLGTLADSSKRQESFSIEELQFDVAITNEGKLALVSAFITEQQIRHVIKLRIKHIGQEWKFTRSQINRQPTEESETITSDFTSSQILSSRSIGTYTIPATVRTPALIIFLLDVGASMSLAINGRTRIQVVTDLLRKIAIKMVQRSIKGTIVAPRYRIAMYAYSSQVIDLLGSIKTIEELANMGVPQLTTLDVTNTAAAFAEAEHLLKSELPSLDGCPAPLICHITDGEYNMGGDPTPIAQRIMKMSVSDGNVLIENIIIRETALSIPNIQTWPGIKSSTELMDSYLQHLYKMSSPLPDNYRSVMNEYGYQLQSGARMLLPGDAGDLIELCFAMSGATPTSH